MPQAKKEPVDKGWVPHRRGAIYCSPRCGCGCKYADYLRAKRLAEAMARELGGGWIAHTSENGQWYASAYFGRVDHDATHIDAGIMYGVVEYSGWMYVNGTYLGTPSLRTAVQFIVHGHTTPTAALKGVLRQARAHARAVNVAIDNLVKHNTEDC